MNWGSFIKNVPIDTWIISAIAVAFEVYVLFIWRKDIAKWVTRVARHSLKVALRPLYKRYKCKNSPSVGTQTDAKHKVR